MSVGKIALGVFLGNLAFGLLAWVAIEAFVERSAAKMSLEQAQAESMALGSREKPAGGPPLTH